MSEDNNNSIDFNKMNMQQLMSWLTARDVPLPVNKEKKAFYVQLAQSYLLSPGRYKR